MERPWILRPCPQRRVQLVVEVARPEAADELQLVRVRHQREQPVLAQ